MTREYPAIKACAEWFEANRENLLSKYSGRYLAIADGRVLGDYADQLEGIRATLGSGHGFGQERSLTMALAISNIPVLTGEAAERFLLMAEEAERNRGCIDFSKEREEWRDFERINAERVAEMRKKYAWLS